MVGVPAHCDVCGLTFLSDFIVFDAPTLDASLHNNEVPCPNGHIAHIIDGTFDFVNGDIRVKNASPETLVIIEALQKALRAAQAGHDEKDIIGELEKSSSEFGVLAHAATKKGGIVFLIVLLVYLLTSCSENIDQKLDWNMLVDQAKVYLFGGDAYPGLGRTEANPSPIEQTQEPSRQQRRYIERQSKKQTQPTTQPNEPRLPRGRPRPKR